MSGKIQGNEVFHGKLIRVYLQPIVRPSGKTVSYEVVAHPDAAAIVAVRLSSEGSSATDPEIALVRQDRPAIGKETWEIPAGLVKPDETDPQQTALRELREETGYDGGKLQFLNRHYPSPGFTNECIWIYLATELQIASGSPAPDPNEIMQLEWKPLSEAMAMCLNGMIDDGKTIIGLWLARDVLRGDAAG